MSIEQLTGRYFRLKQELEIVDQRTPWRRAHIDRLAKELSAVADELGMAPGPGDGAALPPIGQPELRG